MKKTAKERWMTLPNFLSAYRILIFPYVLYLALGNDEKLFIVFLCINLITDILDGLIARLFKLQTQIGAILDTVGDIGTYILAFVGIYYYKLDELQGHLWLLWAFAGIYLISLIIPFFRYGRLPGLHTYMFKATGYWQGSLIFALFVFGFNAWHYHAALWWGIVACLEEIAIFIVMPKPRSNVKGLNWVLKHQKENG